MEHRTTLQQATHDLRLSWSWCTRCQRTYVSGTCRVVRFEADALHPHPATLYLCPYVDCRGSTKRDAWLWATLQLEHPEYPAIPERNVVYVR